MEGTQAKIWEFCYSQGMVDYFELNIYIYVLRMSYMKREISPC